DSIVLYTCSIARYPSIDRFGYALTLLGCAQFALVAGVTDERDLRQNGRHVGADQDDEWGLLHASISNSGILIGFPYVQRPLDRHRKLARLVNLLFEGDLLHQVLQLVH